MPGLQSQDCFVEAYLSLMATLVVIPILWLRADAPEPVPGIRGGDDDGRKQAFFIDSCVMLPLIAPNSSPSPL